MIYKVIHAVFFNVYDRAYKPLLYKHIRVKGTELLSFRRKSVVNGKVWRQKSVWQRRNQPKQTWEIKIDSFDFFCHEKLKRKIQNGDNRVQNRTGSAEGILRKSRENPRGIDEGER